MQSIFTGLFLIFFDFELNLTSYTVGILPDFLGYFLIWRGLRSFPKESADFQPAAVCAAVLAAVGAILYGLRLFQHGSAIVVSAFRTFAPLLLTWLICRALAAFEDAQSFSFGVELLRKKWNSLAVVTGLGFVCSFFSVLRVLGAFALLLARASFLVKYHAAQQTYLDRKKPG